MEISELRQGIDLPTEGHNQGLDISQLLLTFNTEPMSAPGEVRHELLGASDRTRSLLIAAWLSLMIYVLVIDRAIYYFRNYSTDKLIIKAAVLGVVVCDTLMTVVACTNCYTFGVIRYGSGFSNIDLNFRIIDDAHICRRRASSAIARLARNIVLRLHRCFGSNRASVYVGQILVSVTQSSLVYTQLAGTVYSIVALVIGRRATNRPQVGILPGVITWLASGMVADVSIAALLVKYYLSTDVGIGSGRRLIRRLVALAVKTGSFTALTAILTLISFLSAPQTNVSLIFKYTLPRVYSLTLLYNLNIRQKLRSAERTRSSYARRTVPIDILVNRREYPTPQVRVTSPLVSNDDRVQRSIN
ncbi:hypothetical protein D9758_016657 [Tetrapyrgos nigripes]|uniref:DUF6534 domain-containing protein n=1 Tax=Tetrapyrgos nigripes TaxID=182062 RepID=A0A8H5CGZ1_9AGAR|nr:hypothetical protein D9758_016657 [Tetrapyrgos nigripes]